MTAFMRRFRLGWRQRWPACRGWLAMGGLVWAQGLSITEGVVGKDSRFRLEAPPPYVLDSLRREARAGSVTAQMALVEYFQLIDLKPDSARFYLAKAAAAGLAEAQYLLGLIYLRGIEGPKRPAEGRKLLEEAARKNHILALRVLYQVLEPPDSVSPLHVQVLPYDPKAAFQYALQAAQLGDPPSMATVGRYYAQGKGTPRNDSLARSWLRQAAELNYIPAQVLLAQWYLERWNQPDSALYWAQKVLQNERASLEEQYNARIAAYHAEYLPRWIAIVRRLLQTPPGFPQSIPSAP
ncbi:MAG: sel1 repeat family protein [Bacteroidetes bacterium]|nr:MAG: sel1 repeat family protein [Bacteroidota bacterium]